uniref:SFRICE_028686 n=1 Tax=Spodoptera frugiperda TaxID=7108 RepID=A0A2H1X1N3_SPOFR
MKERKLPGASGATHKLARARHALPLRNKTEILMVPLRLEKPKGTVRLLLTKTHPVVPSHTWVRRCGRRIHPQPAKSFINLEANEQTSHLMVSDQRRLWIPATPEEPHVRCRSFKKEYVVYYQVDYVIEGYALESGCCNNPDAGLITAATQYCKMKPISSRKKSSNVFFRFGLGERESVRLLLTKNHPIHDEAPTQRLAKPE